MDDKWEKFLLVAGMVLVAGLFCLAIVYAAKPRNYTTQLVVERDAEGRIVGVVERTTYA